MFKIKKPKIVSPKIDFKKPIQKISQPVKSLGQIPGRIYDKLFLNKQNRRLSKELKRLEKELEKIKRFPDYGNAEDDGAREVQQFVGNLSLRKNFQQLSRDTKEAIEKIKKGTYGKCESCKEDVEAARLKAFPAATLCIKCASKIKRSVRLNI